MVKKIFTILFFIISSSVFCQSELEGIKKEVKNLQGTLAIGNYWDYIYTSDQQNNGEGTVLHDPKVDVLNLYRVTLMIDRFGYPTMAAYNYPNNMVPWLVWTHCPATALKQYTFPIILKGKELGQLPEGFFPNYFVGGFLLNAYGQDMEFDQSFGEGTASIIATALQHFEKTAGKIDSQKVAAKATAYLVESQLLIQKELGQWRMVQLDNTTYFKIVQLQNNNWYLSIKGQHTEPVLHRVLPDLKRMQFKPSEGFGLFYFEIAGAKLQLCNAQGKVIKTSL